MRHALTAAVIAAAAVLAGCGGGPSQSACKAAMTRDYAYALAHPGAPAATRPPACKGLSDAVIQKLAGEIMASTAPGGG
jgi:hypothetical protein